MLNKEKVKELYLLGYNSKEIAKKMGVKQETTKKCIQRNFKECAMEHKKKRLERQDCIRAINSTNNKYIGTEQLIKWNCQSYKYVNDVLIFDRSRGEIPGDMPSRVKREICF